MTPHLGELAIGHEADVVAARRRARELAAVLGFGTHDQIRIATTVSEAARHVLRQGEGGRVGFALEARELVVTVSWRVRPDLDDGAGVDAAGMALATAFRLMDRHAVVEDTDGRLVVVLRKELPADAPAVADTLDELAGREAREADVSSFAELQRQNRELLTTLVALRERQEELTRLTRELEDTNRGVVALYAEIDATARQLRRADEMKSRFLSSMSHELRTPLSSIHALSRLLLMRTDGELTPEQETQVRLISTATGDLMALVDDLLDLAKIESGKVVVRTGEFSVAELFSALRGMLRPLRHNEGVELVVEEPPSGLVLVSDEAKVAQVLRNFVSNALKFTERGEVRVSSRPLDGGRLELRVADTGIGIDAADLDLIFEEFGQIEHEVQRRVKGTGLGLPLCRRLAALLGAEIRVQSEPGAGSVFALVIPVRPSDPAGGPPSNPARATPGPTRDTSPK